jgi:RNA polymerase sigma-70 factor (ECF subfamily)
MLTKDETKGASDSDAAVARAVAGGDADAWDRFFDRFLNWAYRFSYYHLGMNKADAEDLCSDILDTAARNIGKYDATRGSLDVWMLGLARHRLALFCRRRRREVPWMPGIIESESSDEGAGFENRVLTRDQVHCILAGLPERQSTALIGKYLEGYSVEELARILDTTPKAVEMLLRRGRDAFRKALEAMAGGDEDE